MNYAVFAFLALLSTRGLAQLQYHDHLDPKKFVKPEPDIPLAPTGEESAKPKKATNAEKIAIRKLAANLMLVGGMHNGRMIYYANGLITSKCPKEGSSVWLDIEISTPVFPIELTDPGYRTADRQGGREQKGEVDTESGPLRISPCERMSIYRAQFAQFGEYGIGVENVDPGAYVEGETYFLVYMNLPDQPFTAKIVDVEKSGTDLHYSQGSQTVVPGAVLVYVNKQGVAVPVGQVSTAYSDGTGVVVTYLPLR